MDYEILNKYDVFSEYAILKNKCIFLFRPIGVLKYKDTPEVEEVLNHYERILPQEVYHSIKYDEEAYILFDTFEQAHNRCLEWFPLSNELPEQYAVYVHIFDTDGSSKFEITHN